MIKSLFTQLINRKKSNVWIALELLLVFCVLWYLVDYFFVIGCNYSIPSYQNTNHTYQVNITQYPQDHPEFRETENEPSVIEANYARILNHIRTYPGVEAVSVSFDGAIPASPNYNGNAFSSVADSTCQSPTRILKIGSESDFFKVFGYTTDNGKKSVSVQDYEWANPNAIVLNQLAASILFPDGNAIGQQVCHTYSPEQVFEVVGVVDDIKRFSIVRPEPIVYYHQRIDNTGINRAEISIRIDPALSKSTFLPTFKSDMEAALRIGNFYFLSMDSFVKKMRLFAILLYNKHLINRKSRIGNDLETSEVL